MSDQEKKQETNIPPQPDAESEQNKTKLPKSELSEQELEKVSGGVKSWGMTVGSL